jgi:hypothetical protein
MKLIENQLSARAGPPYCREEPFITKEPR